MKIETRGTEEEAVQNLEMVLEMDVEEVEEEESKV